MLFLTPKSGGFPRAAIVLVALLALGLPLDTAWARMVSVASPRAALRAGPGAKYEPLWEFGQGYPLKVVSSKESWYKVVDFENDSGWIEKNQTTGTPHVVVKAQNAELRSGPGPKYRQVGSAVRGVVFRVLDKGKKGTWIKVRHADGPEAWISRSKVWGQ